MALVLKMAVQGGIPRNGIIIYADESSIKRHEGPFTWRTTEPEYLTGDKVLKYSINSNGTGVEVLQYEITSTNPLTYDILMGPKTIEVGATSSKLIDDYNGWKWTVVEKSEEY